MGGPKKGQYCPLDKTALGLACSIHTANIVVRNSIPLFVCRRVLWGCCIKCMLPRGHVNCNTRNGRSPWWRTEQKNKKKIKASSGPWRWAERGDASEVAAADGPSACLPSYVILMEVQPVIPVRECSCEPKRGLEWAEGTTVRPEPPPRSAQGDNKQSGRK